MRAEGQVGRCGQPPCLAHPGRRGRPHALLAHSKASGAAAQAEGSAPAGQQPPQSGGCTHLPAATASHLTHSYQQPPHGNAAHTSSARGSQHCTPPPLHPQQPKLYYHACVGSKNVQQHPAPHCRQYVHVGRHACCCMLHPHAPLSPPVTQSHTGKDPNTTHHHPRATNARTQVHRELPTHTLT